MTDIDGLLRDAGGPRKAESVDALVERLHWEADNRGLPPFDGWGWLHDAAAALAELQAENARVIAEGEIVCNSYVEENQRLFDRAEAEVARLKARVEQRDKQIAVYNSGGFADADALAEKFITLTDELSAAHKDMRESLDRWNKANGEANDNFMLLSDKHTLMTDRAERAEARIAALEAERADLIKINFTIVDLLLDAMEHTTLDSAVDAAIDAERDAERALQQYQDRGAAIAALIAERDALQKNCTVLVQMFELAAAIPSMSDEQLRQLVANGRAAIDAARGDTLSESERQRMLAEADKIIKEL